MKKLIPLFLIIILFESCRSIAWIGYDKPEESDDISIEAVPIKIGMQNLKTEEQKQAIKEATKEVFLIFKSPEFKQAVE